MAGRITQADIDHYTKPWKARVAELEAEIERLNAKLSDLSPDAEKWREREAKIRNLRERGFLGSPLRSDGLTQRPAEIAHDEADNHRSR